MTNGLKKIKIKLTEAPVRSEAEGDDIDLEHLWDGVNEEELRGFFWTSGYRDTYKDWTRAFVNLAKAAGEELDKKDGVPVMGDSWLTWRKKVMGYEDIGQAWDKMTDEGPSSPSGTKVLDDTVPGRQRPSKNKNLEVDKAVKNMLQSLFSQFSEEEVSRALKDVLAKPEVPAVDPYGDTKQLKSQEPSPSATTVPSRKR